MVRGAWCVVRGVWCVVRGAWRTIIHGFGRTLVTVLTSFQVVADAAVEVGAAATALSAEGLFGPESRSETSNLRISAKNMLRNYFK